MATSARIDELLKKFEENPRRYFAPLANEYRKAGDPERAVAICEEHLPQQPGHMSGHIVYGQALFELGRYDEARQVFETALSLDPENLIALRHLGDIARMAGDAHSARIWYQRVLEADPRNEEIAQLMMTLLSTPIATDAIPPTPLSTPAVVARPSSPTPTTAVEEPLDDPQFATTEEIPPPAPRAVAPTYTPFPPASVSPQSFVSRHAPKEDELLDLDSFDLGGVPLSSLRNAKNAEPEPAPEETAGPSDAGDDSAFAEFDEHLSASTSADTSFAEESFVEHSFADGPAPVFQPAAASPTPPLDASDAGIEKTEEFADEFQADPFAIAAKPLTEGDVGSFEEAPPGTIELATDVSLGLPDDGEASSTFTSEEEGPVDGLETFDAGMTVGPASSEITNEALETEAFFDTAHPELTETSADALLDALDEDSDALAGASAFSQISDDSTDALVDESSFAASFETPLDAPLETSLDTSIEVSQGDPLLAPAFGTPAPDVEAVELPTETPDDLAAIATPDTAEAAAYVPDAEASSGEAGAFVTETMATLYLEQGHYDAALDIYRQLVRQRPEDIALRDRLHAAEERAWGHQRDLGVSILDEDTEEAAPFGQDEEAVVPQPRSYGGPTIREFLNGILYRRSAVAVEEPSDFPQPEDTVEPEPQTSSDDDVAPIEEPSLAAEGPSTPAASASDSVSTSLGVLFSEADAAAPSPEPREANSLGGAVATPISGTPAHRAPTELSLDHVFKSNTPRAPEKEGFSFDQFFSEGAAEQQSTPRAEPANEPHVESGDDIAQFNAWLNGLKKS